MNKKVVLIEHVLAHYRKDVFDNLYKSNDFEFEIIAGKNYQGVRSAKSDKGILLKYLTFKFLRHRFYYLKGSLRKVLSQKPDIIISTGIDFHLIHSVIIFFLFRIVLRKQFYWWSHATYGNQGRLGVFFRKIIYRSSTGVFSYNQKGKENLLSMGIKESNIQVVNNSINKEDYGFLNYDIINRERNDTFTLLYSGRVTAAKKLDILVKALGKIKEKNTMDFKCSIVGEGNLSQVIQLAKDLHIDDKIELVGEKYGKDAHPYFLNADIFVYPGGIGLSILHAMSFGLPVLTSDNYNEHGPEIEMLQSGDNGDLFLDNSVEVLANKIEEWKNKINQSKEVYAKNCIQRINNMKYLPDAMSEKVIDFLKENKG